VTVPACVTRLMSLRPRSISIRCSASSLGSARSSFSSARSSVSVCPLGLVPANGRTVTSPFSCLTRISGDEPIMWKVPMFR